MVTAVTTVTVHRDREVRDTNTDEDCDTHDDELQRFAKGVAVVFSEMRDGAMGGNMGSTSATNSDARVKLGVPPSSRTSPAARRVCHPTRLCEACILGAPPLETAMPLRDASFLISAASE